jgi:hypothetical protein
MSPSNLLSHLAPADGGMLLIFSVPAGAGAPPPPPGGDKKGGDDVIDAEFTDKK